MVRWWYLEKLVQTSMYLRTKPEGYFGVNLESKRESQKKEKEVTSGSTFNITFNSNLLSFVTLIVGF